MAWQNKSFVMCRDKTKYMKKEGKFIYLPLKVYISSNSLVKKQNRTPFGRNGLFNSNICIFALNLNQLLLFLAFRIIK